MAKSRSALGLGPGRDSGLAPTHSAPLGTPDSERFGTGHSEPFGTGTAIPHQDRTEAAGAPALTGRPPVLNDEQLLDLARRLNTGLGRPPKADELIHEAGGCQRKRALQALRGLRHEIAQRTVRSQLIFPPAIETQLRGLMDDWLTLAAEHLAQRQAVHSEQLDERLDAAQALIQDLRARLTELQLHAERADTAQRDHLTQIQRLGTERDQLRRERDAVQAVAAERQRVIDQLVLGPASVAVLPSAEQTS